MVRMDMVRMDIASKVRIVKEFVLSLPDWLTPAFLAIFEKQFKRNTFVGVTSHNPPKETLVVNSAKKVQLGILSCMQLKFVWTTILIWSHYDTTHLGDLLWPHFSILSCSHTVATIHERGKSQIWLQFKDDSRHILESCYVLVTYNNPDSK
jgi:hypothetical protein